MADEFESIGSDDFIESLARSIDPLAFENPSRTDMLDRRRRVFIQLRLAMDEWERAENSQEADLWADIAL